jgi:hypothetical protein
VRNARTTFYVWIPWTLTFVQTHSAVTNCRFPPHYVLCLASFQNTWTFHTCTEYMIFFSGFILSLLSIDTTQRSGRPRNWGFIPIMDRNYSFLHSIKTSSVTQPSSRQNCTWGSFHGVKRTGREADHSNNPTSWYSCNSVYSYCGGAHFESILIDFNLVFLGSSTQISGYYLC